MSLCWTTLWDMLWHGSFPGPVCPIAVAQSGALLCWCYSRKQKLVPVLSLNVLFNEVRVKDRQTVPHGRLYYLGTGDYTDSHSARFKQLPFKMAPNNSHFSLDVPVPFRGQSTYNFHNLKFYDKKKIKPSFLLEFASFLMMFSSVGKDKWNTMRGGNRMKTENSPTHPCPSCGA